MGTRETVIGAHYAGLPLLHYQIPSAAEYQYVGWVGDSNAWAANYGTGNAAAIYTDEPARLDALHRRFRNGTGQNRHLRTDLLRTDTLTLIAVMRLEAAGNYGVGVTSEREWTDAAGSQREGILLMVPDTTLHPGTMAVGAFLRRPRTAASFTTSAVYAAIPENRQATRPVFGALTTSVDPASGRLRMSAHIGARDGALISNAIVVSNDTATTAPSGLTSQEQVVSGLRRALTIGGLNDRPSALNTPLAFAAISTTHTADAAELTAIYQSVNRRMAALGQPLID